MQSNPLATATATTKRGMIMEVKFYASSNGYGAEYDGNHISRLKEFNKEG